MPGKNLEASDHIIIFMWIHYNSPYLAVFPHILHYNSVFCHSYSMQYLRQIHVRFLVKKLKKPTLSDFWGDLGADLLEGSSLLCCETYKQSFGKLGECLATFFSCQEHMDVAVYSQPVTITLPCFYNGYSGFSVYIGFSLFSLGVNNLTS